jgi:hypothetical protein
VQRHGKKQLLSMAFPVMAVAFDLDPILEIIFDSFCSLYVFGTATLADRLDSKSFEDCAAIKAFIFL